MLFQYFQEDLETVDQCYMKCKLDIGTFMIISGSNRQDRGKIQCLVFVPVTGYIRGYRGYWSYLAFYFMIQQQGIIQKLINQYFFVLSASQIQRQGMSITKSIQILKSKLLKKLKDLQDIESQEKPDRLVINYIYFEKIPPIIKDLIQQSFPKLCQLSINNCDLRTLENFPCLPCLYRLNISKNSLQGSFEFIVKNRSLRELDVSYNMIKDLNKFQPFKRLQKISIYGNYNPFLNGTGVVRSMVVTKLKNYKIILLKDPIQQKKEPKQNKELKKQQNFKVNNESDSRDLDIIRELLKLNIDPEYLLEDRQFRRDLSDHNSFLEKFKHFRQRKQRIKQAKNSLFGISGGISRIRTGNQMQNNSSSSMERRNLTNIFRTISPLNINTGRNNQNQQIRVQQDLQSDQLESDQLQMLSHDEDEEEQLHELSDPSEIFIQSMNNQLRPLQIDNSWQQSESEQNQANRGNQ